MADCSRECHQGFELGVGPKENKENVVNETFPKWIRWRNVRIVIVRSSLPMKRGNRHGTWGGS